MGALVGGIYAAGKLSEFKKWLLNLDKIDVFKLMDFTLLNKGFIKGDKVFNELNEFIPDVKIQDLNINYQAIATDLTNRKEVVFTKGDLLKAIRASVSIPNILTPVKRGKSILVDGGVINNLPINHAIRKNKDILVAVNVNANIPLPENEKKKEKIEEKESFYKDLLKKFNNGLSKLFPNDKKIPLGYFDIMNDSLEIMRDELVKFSLEIYPPDILIETPRDMCRMFDFYKAKELIEVGQKATIKSLDDNKN